MRFIGAECSLLRAWFIFLKKFFATPQSLTRHHAALKGHWSFTMNLLPLLLILAAPAPQPKLPADPAADAPAQAVTANEDAKLHQILDGVQKFYAEASDFQALFVQTYTYQAYQRTQISKGKVYFKKPGRMRWDYTEPVPKVFVSDSETFWIYEPEERQAFKQPLKKAQLPVALTFMSGEGRFEDAFDAKLLPNLNDDTYHIEIIPKANEGDYKALRLEVDSKTYAVKASTVVDPVGNTNHLTFSDVKTNRDLKDSGFRFVPPDGVRILSDR